MTELTLHLHAIETNNQGDASFSTIAIALNRDHMAHLAHLYQAARILKADVAVHHLNCETEHGDLKENTITITPCGEIECEFADPVPSDWPILLTSSGYLTMDALVKAYAWAQQQDMPCSAFIPRDSRTIYLVANEALIADPALEAGAIEYLGGEAPASFYVELAHHQIEQTFVSHAARDASYNNAGPLWPNANDARVLDEMIERVSGASANAMEPVTTKNEESTLRNYRVGITRTAYSSEKFVEVVATCAEEAEEQALRLAEDMEFSTTTSELDAECVEVGTVEQGKNLIWRDPDTEQESIVTFEAVSGDVVRCSKAPGDALEVYSRELSPCYGA
ncbi:hypothetical protein [Marinobacter sp. MBR-105]|jgi:hypothetical protein